MAFLIVVIFLMVAVLILNRYMSAFLLMLLVVLCMVIICVHWSCNTGASDKSYSKSDKGFCSSHKYPQNDIHYSCLGYKELGSHP